MFFKVTKVTTKREPKKLKERSGQRLNSSIGKTERMEFNVGKRKEKNLKCYIF